MRFILEGASAAERGLYIVLSETERELRETAASHGWTLDDQVEVLEVAPAESLLDEQQQQTLLYSSDLELGEAIKSIFKVFERVKPDKVVLDSLSEIRLLSQSSLRYRRQLLAITHYFARRQTTVLLLDDLTSDINDKTVHSVAHGVIQLEEMPTTYGSARRRLRVPNTVASPFASATTTIRSGPAEVAVYPRLVAAEHRTRFARAQVTSGLPGLDALLGGGLEQGTSTLILGPAGAGKSTFAIQFLATAIRRGEKAAMFVFDEELAFCSTG